MTPRKASFFQQGSTEPLLVHEKSCEDNSVAVKAFARALGVLFGLLIHLSTLGINLWFTSLGIKFEESQILWSVISATIIGLLVVLVYIVLGGLSDVLQSLPLITLALETNFVASFLCSLVFASSFYDTVVLVRLGGTFPIVSVTSTSLFILMGGWISIRAYEKARLREIAEETDELECSS